MTALAPTVAHRFELPRLAVDALLVVGGSLLVAALAQVTIKLPFTPVPITLQTLGVMVVAGSLGWLLGTLSLALYLAEGAVGLPFYADGKSGVDYLFTADGLHATGGYLWGFVVAALVIGYLSERGWDRGFGSSIGAMVIGEIIIFTFGILWLAAALDVPVVGAAKKYDDALDFGFYPFVIGDVIKVLLAAGLLPTAWRLLGRRRTPSFKR